MKNCVEKLLLELGCAPHLRGYNYIVTVCEIAEKDSDVIYNVVKQLYPQIAKEYGTTPSRVERAIRTAVEYTFNNIDFDLMQEIFGNTVSARLGKPTNSHFIAAVTNYIRRTDNEQRE